MAGSQRHNERVDTLLEHSHQISPIDVLCTKVSLRYISAAVQHAHSPSHIQRRVEGHCIRLRRHLTLSVPLGPLANLPLFLFLLVFWSRTGCMTSGRGRQSLRDRRSTGCLKVRGCQINLLPGYNSTFILRLRWRCLAYCICTCVLMCECLHTTFFMCLVRHVLTNMCVCVTVDISCECILLCLSVFLCISERDWWKEEQEGAPPPTQQAFRPHG